MKQQLIDTFQGKSIAIAGFGVEGKAAYELLKQLDCNITVIDEDESTVIPAGVSSQLGSSWLSGIDSYDLVLRSSGMPPDKLAGARRATTSSNLLLKLYGSQVIAVTGTKGKTTTVSLIAEILRSIGVKVELVGNIGRSAWEVLATDVASDTAIVAELSSFQLSDADYSPHIAGLLPITNDHLDWHPSLEHYYDSKLRITTHQSSQDYCFSDQRTADRFSLADTTEATLKLTDEIITQTDTQLQTTYGSIEIDKLQLQGQHNINDIKLAVSTVFQWVEEHEIDMTIKWQSVETALYDFQPLLYHLDPLGTIDGKQIINDSYASNPTATLAAIKAITGGKTIIIGGHSKGAPIKPLIKQFDACNVQAAIIIGANRSQCDELAEAVRELSSATAIVVGEQKMDTIVARAIDAAAERTTILFSPAHASFDMYTNFGERGRLFSESVKKLQETA